MAKKLSPNIQDYLKRIYELTHDGGFATTSEMAALLDISPASVTNMIQKLSRTDPPYLHYKKHQGVKLTELGRQTALKILRRHRLIELFLVKALGYDWDEVHEEAEILEHAMSSKLEARIDEALGHPHFDPHGDPIPDENLSMPMEEQTLLNALSVGARGRIIRVPHEDPEVLRYLGKTGLTPGTRIELLNRTAYDQTMQIKILDSGQEAVIGPTLGGQISLSVDS